MRVAAAPSPFDLDGRPALSQIESAEEIELSSESDGGMIGVSFDFRDGAVTQRTLHTVCTELCSNCVAFCSPFPPSDGLIMQRPLKFPSNASLSAPESSFLGLDDSPIVFQMSSDEIELLSSSD